jgi:hypothetical protein
MAGRKPVHLTTVGGKPHGRQIVWEAMRRLRIFTVSGLAEEIDHHRSTIRDYVECLRAGGFVTILSTKVNGARKTHTYELTRDVGVEAPKLRKDGTPSTQGLATEQMWRTMKMMGNFTPRELAISATTELQPVDEVHALDYVGHLFSARYLALVAKSTPTSQARYRFLSMRNTGPRPPMVQRLKTVFDPNLGQIVWHEEPAE